MAVYLGQYQVGMYGLTDLSGASIINNQNKTVNPSTSQQSITFDSGYTGLGTVTVNAMPTGTAGTPTAAKGTVSNHSISVTPSVTNTTGYITGSTKTGTAVTVTASELVSGTKSISANGTNIDVTNYAKVDVSVPTGSTISNQDKTVNPSTSVQEVTYDSGYTGLGTVTVNAMPGMTLPTSAAASAISGYTSKATIGRSTSDQYINIGTGYNAAGGYYKISAVANGTAGTPSASKGTVSNHSVTITPSVTNTTGYITGGTISGTAITVSASELASGNKSITSNGTNIDVVGYSTVSVSVDTGGGSPTIDSLSVTPSESEQTFNSSSVDGYKPVVVGAISSTYVGSGITRRDNTDLMVSADQVLVPAGYYSSNTGVFVNTGVVTAPASISGTSASISTSSGTLTLTKTISVTPSITTAGYISEGTAGNSTVSLTASVTINPTLTASGATVTAPAGYYSTDATKSVSSMTLPSAVSSTSSGTSKATLTLTGGTKYLNIPTGYNSTAQYYTLSVASGSATGPSSVSGTSATVSTGTNTLTLTKTGVSTTPTVSAGYVSSATSSTATVTLTASVTTKAAATYHPSTTAQSISSGTYLTGAQTIAAVTTSNLSASNIVSGVTIKVGDSSDDDCVASVTGNVVLQNYYTGSSAPSSSTGSNGDLYLQS